MLTNWSGQLGGLSALSHELGHGLHFALAGRAQTEHSCKTGLTISEIPSTFAELLLVEHLLSTDENLGRALLARELDQAVISAYMAAAFARFEQGAYALRAEGQALWKAAGPIAIIILEDFPSFGVDDDRNAEQILGPAESVGIKTLPCKEQCAEF